MHTEMSSILLTCRDPCTKQCHLPGKSPELEHLPGHCCPAGSCLQTVRRPQPEQMPGHCQRLVLLPGLEQGWAGWCCSHMMQWRLRLPGRWTGSWRDCHCQMHLRWQQQSHQLSCRPLQKIQLDQHSSFHAANVATEVGSSKGALWVGICMQSLKYNKPKHEGQAPHRPSVAARL